MEPSRALYVLLSSEGDVERWLSDNSEDAILAWRHAWGARLFRVVRYRASPRVWWPPSWWEWDGEVWRGLDPLVSVPAVVREVFDRADAGSIWK